MVKPRKILSFSESSPQFFNVYVPNQSYHRLRIPPDFVKDFSGVLPYKSTITSPEKRSWHLELKKVDGKFYFHEGWQQFVLDNSLQFGDFLIFYYGGNSQFYVKIYGKNGCRKEVTEPARQINREITRSKENETVERRRSKRLAQEADGEEIAQKNLCRRVPMAVQEGNRALNEANKFVSKFPFFKVVISPSYLKNGLLNIPSSFHNRYMGKDRKEVILFASGRYWPVKLATGEPTIRRLWQGWRTFSNENTLKRYDVCVFELIERKDFVLKVSIFRCPD